MSTIKTQNFSKVILGDFNPATGHYSATLAADVEKAVLDNGGVLVFFRQSNTGSGWMQINYAAPNNFWVYSYGLNEVTIANTSGPMANGIDFKIVTIVAD